MLRNVVLIIGGLLIGSSSCSVNLDEHHRQYALVFAAIMFAVGLIRFTEKQGG
jgi:hypothetical protein